MAYVSLEEVAALSVLVCVGCAQSLDAGSGPPRGLLPVDERNPIILANDNASDNWQGEYAVLLANGGGAKLAGIVVNASAAWPNLDANVSGWRSLVTAARASGLQGVPDPISSVGAPLTRPDTGNIPDTQPNRSEGARFIVEESARSSLPYRPLVVVTGGRLTDVADAYLLDPTVVQRIVVVSSLGRGSGSGAAMSNPNGEMDPWADTIVAQRFRYVQVSSYYDQTLDVPNSRKSELPSNAFGSWIAQKQSSIFDLPEAADQVGVLAAGLTSFTTSVVRVSPSGSVGAAAAAGPNLAPDPNGNAWLVTQAASALASAKFWGLLLDPSTFVH